MSLDILWRWIGKATIIHENGEWRLRVCLVESEMGMMENDEEKMEKMWVLKVGMRKKMIGPDSFLSKLTKTLSPPFGEKSQKTLVESCSMFWTKLSQSNIHIIWTSISFPSKLFCLLLSFVVLSLFFLFVILSSDFFLPFCAYRFFPFLLLKNLFFSFALILSFPNSFEFFILDFQIFLLPLPRKGNYKQ